MEQQQHYYYGTGRRKTSVARVRIYTEQGPIIVNGRTMEEMFGWPTWREHITEPFTILYDRAPDVDVVAIEYLTQAARLALMEEEEGPILAVAPETEAGVDDAEEDDTGDEVTD